MCLTVFRKYSSAVTYVPNRIPCIRLWPLNSNRQSTRTKYLLCSSPCAGGKIKEERESLLVLRCLVPMKGDMQEKICDMQSVYGQRGGPLPWEAAAKAMKRPLWSKRRWYPGWDKNKEKTSTRRGGGLFQRHSLKLEDARPRDNSQGFRKFRFLQHLKMWRSREDNLRGKAWTDIKGQLYRAWSVRTLSADKPILT